MARVKTDRETALEDAAADSVGIHYPCLHKWSLLSEIPQVRHVCVRNEEHRTENPRGKHMCMCGRETR